MLRNSCGLVGALCMTGLRETDKRSTYRGQGRARGRLDHLKTALMVLTNNMATPEGTDQITFIATMIQELEVAVAQIVATMPQHNDGLNSFLRSRPGTTTYLG
mmetsp:Transcript_24463/g.44116  ORF Transcript_24463/g.44116 Transcript_24463/m.44116 type:complete len:103 (+) Transcript_24463:925-1233(+)